MKKFITYISISAFLLSLATGCQKKWEMIPPPTPIIDELGPEVWEKGTTSVLFVTTFGNGELDGSSWDNSMDVVGFRDLLKNQKDLGSTLICVAEGTYLMSENAGYGPTVSKNIGMIKGGFSQYSTGTDLTQWDPKTHRTIFSGDLNENGKADEGDCGLMYITGGQINVSNVEFENGYISDKLATAIQAQNCGIGVNGSSATATAINLTECSITGCNSQEVVQGANAGGAAIKVTVGFARLRDCTITNCKTSSRGGALRTLDKNGVLFLDRCKIYDNKVDGMWGGAIQLTGGHLCINNSTIYGNPVNGAQVNGSGSIFISNSTIIGTDSDSYGCLRMETLSGDQAFFVNNLLFSTGSGSSFTKNISNPEILSKGYNIYEKENNGSYGTMVLPSDTQISKKPTGTLTDNIFVCDPAQFSLSAVCGVDQIIEALDAYNPKSGSSIVDLGTQFKEWVGLEGFVIDQRGCRRPDNSFQPGAYDGKAAEADKVLTVSPSVVSHDSKAAMTSEDLKSFRMIVDNPVSKAFCYNTNMLKQSGKWAPQSGGVLYWDDAKTPVTIIGLSPFSGSAEATSTIVVSVRENQTSDEFVKDSDFLLAKMPVDPKLLEGEPVKLSFSHMFAKLNVTIKYGSSPVAESDIKSVSVNGLSKTATFDLTKTAPAAAVISSPAFITLHREGAYYEGIFVPQSAKLNVSFLYNGNSYAWKSASAVTLEAGYEYTLEITIDDTKAASGRIVSATMR